MRLVTQFTLPAQAANALLKIRPSAKNADYIG
jgi:hypothetical protein